MEKLEYLSYDENVDHLTIYKANADIDTNIDGGLVILSLNKLKDIVGIEFMGAHKNFNIPTQTLEHLKSCKVTLKYIAQNQIIIINVQLKTKDEASPLVFSSHTDLGNDGFFKEFECAVV